MSDKRGVMPSSDRTERPFLSEIYYQSTEFTCGPACLVMAMAALDPSYKASRLEEMKIWRRAGLAFMGEGHAGCGPYGLALAALQRGFHVEIYEHNADNLFKIWTKSEKEAAIQTLLDDDDRENALDRKSVV